MRKLFLLLAVSALNVYAQDVIVKKDGSTILSKVLEVNPNDVKYKKFSNQNGPTYTIDKSELMSINYQNGEHENFNNASTTPTTQASSSSARYIQKPADARNAELISLYNKYYSPTKEMRKSKSKTKFYTLIFGVMSSSVMSNEDIEMTFVRDFFDVEGLMGHVICYINIKNKTDKTIYIDKGNCFKMYQDGTYYCYYAPTEQMTVTQGGGSGASLGLGSVAGALGIGGAVGQLASGISVGGGSSHSVSTTYTQQRFIVIPPHANKNLSEEKAVYTKGAGTIFSGLEYEMVDKAENFNISELSQGLFSYSNFVVHLRDVNPKEYDLKLQKGLKKGDVIEYNENNSPYSRAYILTYSTDEDFHTYSSLKAEVYLHEIIGTDEQWKNKFNKGSTCLSEDNIEGVNPYMIEGSYVADK